MSMHVRELGAHRRVRLDAARPGDDHRVAGAAEVAGDLLAPAGTACCRRAPRPPAKCGAVCGPPSASTPPYFSISLRLLVGVEHEAVEEGQLVERAGGRALHAGAVVAPDVEDERVVEVAHLLDGVEQPADVPVGVLLVAGVDLHLPGVELLLRVGEGVPRRESVGPLGQLGVLRDDAELLLALERLPRAACPSRRRTCPCTCRPTPWRRGAARARSRWSSTSSTASAASCARTACSHSTALSVMSSGK